MASKAAVTYPQVTRNREATTYLISRPFRASSTMPNTTAQGPGIRESGCVLTDTCQTAIRNKTKLKGSKRDFMDTDFMDTDRSIMRLSLYRRNSGKKLLTADYEGLRQLSGCHAKNR